MRWVQQLQWRYRKWRFRAARRRDDRTRRWQPGSGAIELATAAGAALCLLALWNWWQHHRSLMPHGDPTDVAYPLAAGLVLLALSARWRPRGPAHRATLWAIAVLTIGGIIFFLFTVSLLAQRLLEAWVLSLVAFLALVGIWTWRLGRDER